MSCNYTLIIPHFNAVDSLEQLCETIPEREDLQVIIIDDCSTEEIDKLAALKASYSRFEWCSTESNRGGGAARNVGLQKAVGQWVLFADADDLFTENLNAVLDDYADKRFDIVYFNADIVNRQSSNKHARFLDIREEIIDKRAVDKIKYRLTTVWAKLFSKKLIDDHQLRFEESIISNDVMFSTLTDYYADAIEIDPRPLYVHIKHNKSVTGSKTIQQNFIKLDTHCRRLDFLNSHGCPCVDIQKYLGYPLKFIFKHGRFSDKMGIFSVLRSCTGEVKRAAYTLVVKIYLSNLRTAIRKKGSRLRRLYETVRYRAYSLRRWGRRFYQLCRVPLKLDIHAAEHCNLNCLGCTHFSTLAKPEFCDLKQLEHSMQKLSRFRKSFGTLQILGGEPLLNPDLCEMMSIIRRYFKEQTLTLVTNGLLLLSPDKLPVGFWEACRKYRVVIKLTRYPINFNYDAVEALCEREQVPLDVWVDRSENGRGWHRFLLNEQGAGVRAFKYGGLFKLMQCRSVNCSQLVGDRIYPCSHVAYVHHLNRAFGTNFKQKKGDYISVDKLWCSFQIRKKMLFSTPFCHYCGAGVPDCQWRVSKRDPGEWIVE